MNPEPSPSHTLIFSHCQGSCPVRFFIFNLWIFFNPKTYHWALLPQTHSMTELRSTACCASSYEGSDAASQGPIRDSMSQPPALSSRRTAATTSQKRIRGSRSLDSTQMLVNHQRISKSFQSNLIYGYVLLPHVRKQLHLGEALSGSGDT